MPIGANERTQALAYDFFFAHCFQQGGILRRWPQACRICQEYAAAYSQWESGVEANTLVTPYVGIFREARIGRLAVGDSTVAKLRIRLERSGNDMMSQPMDCRVLH
jgi:hypothetical protein